MLLSLTYLNIYTGEGEERKKNKKRKSREVNKKHCIYYREIESFTALCISRMCPLLSSYNRTLDTNVK
jgi:hypothetical protein